MSALLVAPVSSRAVTFACERWHYAGRVPYGKKWARGVWEDGRFVGVVVFGRGSSPRMSEFWGLKQVECVELVRVALRDHATPVSQIVAQALRELKTANPGLRLVVSFADPGHGHHGGIYQAGNWIFCGLSKSGGEFVIRGRQQHMRAVGYTYGTTDLAWIREHLDPDAYLVQPADKYRYAMPLDRAMRREVLRRQQPTPEPLAAPLPPQRVDRNR